MADNALRNHVIQLVQVNDKDQCELLCYLEQMCLSFNFGSGNCELSNSDHYQHPADLVSRIGFSYHPTAVSVLTCIHKCLTWCKSNFTNSLIKLAG